MPFYIPTPCRPPPAGSFPPQRGGRNQFPEINSIFVRTILAVLWKIFTPFINKPYASVAFKPFLLRSGLISAAHAFSMSPQSRNSLLLSLTFEHSMEWIALKIWPLHVPCSWLVDDFLLLQIHHCKISEPDYFFQCWNLQSIRFCMISIWNSVYDNE